MLPERSEGSPKNRIDHASYQRDVCFDCEIRAPPSREPGGMTTKERLNL